MPGAREGFQPCAMDVEAGVEMPKWERNLVIFALCVHVLDIVLDLAVLLFFFIEAHMDFFIGSCSVILFAWFVSSLYVSFGGSQGTQAGDGIDSPRSGPLLTRITDFCCNFAQVQIFTEAYRCIVLHGDTDYFHTLRLMEAILESAPNSVVQLYALVSWMAKGTTYDFASVLLCTSVVVSFLSVGLGLAMWEQKVQFRAPGAYVAAVAVMRSLEIASRSLTLAIFASLTIPFHGFWLALIIDYCGLVCLIVKHQSVQLTYGFFLAVPLVFVSLEPLVWRREDHAVPKDNYYALRIVEFLAMWMYIIHAQGTEVTNEQINSIALLTTLLMYLMLPCVFRVARQHELSRDVADWTEDGGENSPFTGGPNFYSDSEGSHSDSGSDGARGALLDDNVEAE
jgi:hypothetical protein